MLSVRASRQLTLGHRAPGLQVALPRLRVRYERCADVYEMFLLIAEPHTIAVLNGADVLLSPRQEGSSKLGEAHSFLFQTDTSAIDVRD